MPPGKRVFLARPGASSPAPHPDQQPALNVGDHLNPSVKQAVGVEKGLKKTSETWASDKLPFLESSWLFTVPGAALLQEKALTECKAPGEPGWTRTDRWDQGQGRQTSSHHIFQGRFHI